MWVQRSTTTLTTPLYGLHTQLVRDNMHLLSFPKYIRFLIWSNFVLINYTNSFPWTWMSFKLHDRIMDQVSNAAECGRKLNSNSYNLWFPPDIRFSSVSRAEGLSSDVSCREIQGAVLCKLPDDGPINKGDNIQVGDSSLLSFLTLEFSFAFSLLFHAVKV